VEEDWWEEGESEKVISITLRILLSDVSIISGKVKSIIIPSRFSALNPCMVSWSLAIF